jgi:hypothetical protein
MNERNPYRPEAWPGSSCDATPTIGAPIARRSAGPRPPLTAPQVAGGCDFAVDPQLDALSADIYWLPAVDPRVIQLIAATTTAATLAVPPGVATIERVADDGRYLLLGARPDSSAAMVLPGAKPDGTLVAVLPLDRDVPYRADALVRLWRRLTGKLPGRAADGLSTARRKRLVLSLRAVDARRAGANRREIAEVLFGAETVPGGVAFDDHHLRSRTSRLIRDGLAMIAGGYRKLLRD